jgi:hypothetical protein
MAGAFTERFASTLARQFASIATPEHEPVIVGPPGIVVRSLGVPEHHMFESQLPPRTMV